MYTSLVKDGVHTSAKKSFNDTVHKYEVNMRHSVQMIECFNSPRLPGREINYASLSEIKMSLGRSVNVIAVVHNMTKPVDSNSKKWDVKKMIVNIVDKGASLVESTI